MPAVKRQSLSRLRELQRLTARAILRPLGRDGRPQPVWFDGRPTRQAVAEFIKPNDRLTSFQRLAIYNRQYWFRVLDSLYDDFPGLHAILGDRQFEKLRIAYLEKFPSQSFTLRNLGSRLEQFLREEPHWAGPHLDTCLDMARFEWAQIVAFDEAQRPAIIADDLLGRDPSKLRLALQPYVTLLEMRYPLDDFILAVKKRNSLRDDASNAMDADRKERRSHRPRLPKPEQAFLAVHRFENSLYYKRLQPAQFRLLIALRDGATLAGACDLAGEGEADANLVDHVRTWFKTWMELGWFCRRT